MNGREQVPAQSKERDAFRALPPRHECRGFTRNLMTATVAQRVQKRRATLRSLGLRPIQLWVPDTRRASFAQECLRQSQLLRQDPQENELLRLTEAAALDTEGWN